MNPQVHVDAKRRFVEDLQARAKRCARPD